MKKIILSLISISIIASTAYATEADPNLAAKMKELIPVAKVGYVDDRQIETFFERSTGSVLLADAKGFDAAAQTRWGSLQSNLGNITPDGQPLPSKSYAQIYITWYELRERMTATDLRKYLIMLADHTLTVTNTPIPDKDQHFVMRSKLSFILPAQTYATNSNGFDAYDFIFLLMNKDFARTTPVMKKFAGQIFAGSVDQALATIRGVVDDEYVNTLVYFVSKM